MTYLTRFKKVAQNFTKQSKVWKIIWGVCLVATIIGWFTGSLLINLFTLGCWIYWFWGGLGNWGDD